jgi:hypothetical protein
MFLYAIVPVGSVVHKFPVSKRKNVLFGLYVILVLFISMMMLIPNVLSSVHNLYSSIFPIRGSICPLILIRVTVDGCPGHPSSTLIPRESFHSFVNSLLAYIQIAILICHSLSTKVPSQITDHWCIISGAATSALSQKYH